jgi:hypothetical protein
MEDFTAHSFYRALEVRSILLTVVADQKTKVFSQWSVLRACGSRLRFVLEC